MPSSASTPTTTSASFSTSRHGSSSSFSSLSLAFSVILPKQTSRPQATIESVECSSANSTILLLQPKHNDGPLNGLLISEEEEFNGRPETEEEIKVRVLREE